MALVYIDQYHSGVFRDCLSCELGENLYQVLIASGISLSGASCKGAGVCRGCMVYIVEEGMECLACRYIIQKEELHVVFQERIPEQSVLLTQGINVNSIMKNIDPTMKCSDSTVSNEKDDIYNPRVQNIRFWSDHNKHSNLGVAIDLGTTTIASALVELSTGEVLSEAGCMNRQAFYGTDVVSRIQYACSEEKDGTTGLMRLHDLVVSDLTQLIESYIKQGYDRADIRKICISGNPTMLHILLKLSLEGMKGYPFTPVRLSGERFEYQGTEILILPGKSAFVGADIVSGVRYLGLGLTEEYELFLDLGTNGELWLLNSARGVCTSTSCGSAFANCVTRGQIYGTSMLDAVAKAIREGNIDETGLLQEPYFEQGIPCGEYVLTQDTIRQIQLAKAAIRTGIELAAYELRIPLENIGKVYLAGGFGFYLNPESAYILGLLPEEFRDRITIVGNTSLKGAIQALIAEDSILVLPVHLEKSLVLDLSMNKNFQEFFLHRIQFGE